MKTKNEKRKTKRIIWRTKAFSIFVLLFTLYALRFTLVPTAQAFTMSSSDWIIEMGNFVTASGKSTGEKNSILTSVGQTGPGLYSGKNYSVKAGFAYIYPLGAFSFTLSDTHIDFGLLSATTPVNRTSTITISNPSSPGYQVLAYESSPLVNETNIAINDTTCDNGSCSETTSAPWVNNLTYGFGYRCDPIKAINCSRTFSDADYYRQFADLGKGESPQTIVAGKGAGRDRSAKITYKLNISGTQMAGNYNNTITYIAAPSF